MVPRPTASFKAPWAWSRCFHPSELGRGSMLAYFLGAIRSSKEERDMFLGDQHPHLRKTSNKHISSNKITQMTITRRIISKTARMMVEMTRDGCLLATLRGHTSSLSKWELIKVLWFGYWKFSPGTQDSMATTQRCFSKLGHQNIISTLISSRKRNRKP